MYSDKNLTCADCGQEFVFTASEQDFYAQRGFTEPRRCASCRASRKAARNAERRRQLVRRLRRRRRVLRRRVATAAAVAAATAPAIAGRARCSPQRARAAAARPRSRSARRAASPSTAAIASAASAAADPHPLGAGRPTARRTSVILDPGCQPTGVGRFSAASPRRVPDPHTRIPDLCQIRPGSSVCECCGDETRSGRESSGIRRAFQSGTDPAAGGRQPRPALAEHDGGSSLAEIRAAVARTAERGSAAVPTVKAANQPPGSNGAASQPPPVASRRAAAVELALRAVEQPVDVVGMGHPDQRRTHRRVDDVRQRGRPARPAGRAASPGTSRPSPAASPARRSGSAGSPR